MKTDNSELDLKEIGVKENLFAEMEISDIDTFCRLCFHPLSTNKIDINSVRKDSKLQHILDKNLSELVRTFELVYYAVCR